VRRALVIALVLATVAAGAFASMGAGDTASGTQYKIVFDNAFGLVKGADFKVGGVPVGSIKDLDVHRPDARAIVTVEASDTGFGGLQSDAECGIQPQSLIGEYFVDCQPGKAGERLADGATIPVEQTQSPIPADLVANVMRRPYRERFSIIFSQLGAGLAARGEDLNETIRRSLPALKETDRVLRILGDNRRTLRQLTHDSGEVLSVLGARRKDVGRFVVEAKNTAQATAERRDALAETFRRFPGFLDELQPTMADLGTASSRLAPTFADLRAAAPSLTSLLSTLGPFSRSLDPAFTTLGAASQTGRKAASEARSLVQLLGELGKGSPELAKNAALVLGDLDDRDRAVEPDPDSPGGKGYTGLEAPLQYMFDQSLGMNIFDQRGYILKLTALFNQCDDFTDADEAKADPQRYQACSQPLGPNQPGVTTPDPSPAAAAQRAASERRARTRKPTTGPAADGKAGTPQTPAAPDFPGLPALPDLLDRLPQQLVKEPGGAPDVQTAGQLLDFLLAP
jgi:virulence factor Mce-like protein